MQASSRKIRLHEFDTDPAYSIKSHIQLVILHYLYFQILNKQDVEIGIHGMTVISYLIFEAFNI